MPISPKEWKDGLELGDAELLAVFERTPYQAYTLVDLVAKNDNFLISVAQAFVLHGQLNRLIQKGLVKSKNMRGTTYYISAKAV